MVHTVQHTGYCTAEAWRSQTDASQLGESHLRLGDIVRHLQRKRFGIVVHQSYIRNTQSIIDVGDIALDTLVDFVQFLGTLLLTVVRLHHFCYVATCHVGSHQFTIGIMNGIDGRVIVHLPAHQSKILCMIDGVYKLTEIHDRRGTGVIHRVDVKIGKDRIVLQQELVFKYKVTVRNAKGLAGTLIDVTQHAAGIIIYHINEGGIENRMVAQQQLVDRLLATIFLCHIMLDAQDARNTTAVITTVDTHRDFIMTEEGLVLGIADQRHDSTISLTFTDIEDGGAQRLKVVTIEELGEVNGVIALFHRTLLGKEEVVTGSWQILPDAQASSKQNQRQMGILLFLAGIGLSSTLQVDPVVGYHNQNHHHQDNHYAEHVMLEAP